MHKRLLMFGILAAGIAGSGWWVLRAQDYGSVAHPECTFFGPQRERFLPRNAKQRFQLSETTAQVMRMMAASSGQSLAMVTPPGGTRTFGDRPASGSSNLIDTFIWKAFRDNGVTPAAQTNDYEFIRRVTLDLTGRIPTADQVVSFVNDTNPNKRADLVDELLNTGAWLDKWTMFYGDLFKSAQNWPSIGTAIGPLGRDALNGFIRQSLAHDAPYNQMAQALIGSAGSNNFKQGELNWIVNGRVTGTAIPIQDTYDQMTANIAETFLGLAHMNCLECHNGRGHLDSLSLWGSQTTRMEAWGMTAFLSHTSLTSPLDPQTTQRLWYAVDNNASKTDYNLNTTTGNRPPRQPVGSTKMISPNYIFTGEAPRSGEGYRQALARMVTSDAQFSRAAVNYVWAAFFGMGIVDPPDQFDPARLDPNNPPPAPWTLQPSNPDLLNALAEDFAANNYDVKRLMRMIATSNTYQLESQYDPDKWNPNWQPLFARHLVRRLWGEELLDSMTQSSNVPSNFTVGGVTFPWAMEFPEPGLEPNRSFLTAFLPGNRDDQPRRSDGAIQQALALMNNPLVMAKLNVTTTPAQSLLSKALASPSNDDLVSMLYLNILSRYPVDAEKQAANALLGNATGTTRMQKAQELMWTLYNKVDFIFNY